MHPANRAWWAFCNAHYRPQFDRADVVLEVGMGIPAEHGSLRDHVQARAWLGIDWRPPADVVCLAHEMAFDRTFDVIVSASMLEHDPYWQRSLTRMVELLSPHGLLLVSWGAARNNPHHWELAPDGGFHALPAGKALALLRDLGLHVDRFEYETAYGGGDGEVAVAAFRDAHDAPGAPVLMDLLPEDAA